MGKPYTKIVRLTPNYISPDTLSRNLNRLLQESEILKPTHIAVVDRDVELPEGFYELAEKYPEAEIIGVQVIPSSPVFRVWEETFWFGLKIRIRDCAVIYKAQFLAEQGGFPDSETPGTVLQKKARRTVVAELRAVHHQPFSIKHSLTIQVRDGRSRAKMHYSFWNTLLHSIFRVRPLVFLAFFYYRYRGEKMEFGHPW